MRWDDLFDDLQAQFLAAERALDEERLAELVEAEFAATSFTDRWRARRGQPLTVRLRDGSDRSGLVADVAVSWVVLAHGERRSLIPRAAVVLAWPLGGAAPEPSAVERALGLGHMLRTLAQDGAPVVLHTLAGAHRGRIVRVGADHCDLATGAGVGAVSVPWDALLSVDSM